MQRVEQLRAAGAEIKAAKTAYLPTLTFDGYGGLSHTNAQQFTTDSNFLGPLFTPRTRKPGMQDSALLGISSTASHARIGWPARKPIRNRLRRRSTPFAIRSKIRSGQPTPLPERRSASRERQPRSLPPATESYNAALQSYNYGVRSQIDVVSAQRTLAAARTADVTARTKLLTGVAALAYQTGDLLYAKGP